MCSLETLSLAYCHHWPLLSNDTKYIRVHVYSNPFLDLKKDFGYFDKDKNGTISVGDFATLVRGQGFNPSEKMLVDMTTQYDTDGKRKRC